MSANREKVDTHELAPVARTVSPPGSHPGPSTSVLIAPRDAFGEALLQLGAECKELVVLDADNCLATRSSAFRNAFPQRFINVGVAEQNLVGIASGLAIAGKIPVISTHAIFLCGRAFDQIRNTVAYGRLNVKCVGTHGGITVGHDGPTHFAVEDIALMRSVPGMTVLVPADAVETRIALREAISLRGPVYIRVGRAPVPAIYSSSSDIATGPTGVLTCGRDIAILACGLMVAKSLEAAAVLDLLGVSATVVDMWRIKPLDQEFVEALARSHGALVTAEEHSVHGGMGSAVSEVVCERFPIPIEFVGLRDTFAESGDPDALLAAYGLDVGDVVNASKRAIARKSQGG